MTAYQCLDCPTMLAPRVGTSGRQPERCPPCKLARNRRKAREDYHRRLAELAMEPSLDVDSEYPEERCQECGKALSDGVPWPGKCPECSAR